MINPRKLLLLDGYSTRTLACVRSWGRRQVPFAVGGETRWDMSLYSRYSAETFIYTSPKRDVKRFIDDVNRYAHKFGADCVFPTSEAGILACNEHRNELDCIPIVPDVAGMKAAFDKGRTLAIAESVGVKVPGTAVVTDLQSLKTVTQDLAFPVVIKSASSEVMLGERTQTSGKTVYAFNQNDLVAECRARLEGGQRVLLQQFIDGYGLGVSGLFADGEPVALLAHRRIRESDPLGGPSALAETVALDPSLARAAAAIMREIKFTGPAMIEFKVDRATGEPYLMEINGRFWGTILLAPAAGLDLPYLYWKMLKGLPIEPDETVYQTGIKGRYLLGDTKCLLLCLKGRPPGWPGAFPKRWAAIKSYVQSFSDRKTTDLILTSGDPMPFLARLAQGWK